MDDTEKYVKAVKEQRDRRELDRMIVGFDRIETEFRRRELKRWAQQACEFCGGPLENFTPTDGGHPIRICYPCEQRAIENDASRGRE